MSDQPPTSDYESKRDKILNELSLGLFDDDVEEGSKAERELNYAKQDIDKLVQQERLKAKIEELNHVTVCSLGDEEGAWYEPDEGYQQTIESRRADLTKQLKEYED